MSVVVDILVFFILLGDFYFFCLDKLGDSYYFWYRCSLVRDYYFGLWKEDEWFYIFFYIKDIMCMCVRVILCILSYEILSYGRVL